jgi:hypothetical protein
MGTNIFIMSLFIITVVVQVVFMIIRSIYYRKQRLYCNNDETDRKSSNLCKYYSEVIELYGILIYELEELYLPLLILFIVTSSIVTVLFLLYY